MGGHASVLHTGDRGDCRSCGDSNGECEHCGATVCTSCWADQGDGDGNCEENELAVTDQP
jgi:hypothetical protein